MKLTMPSEVADIHHRLCVKYDFGVERPRKNQGQPQIRELILRGLRISQIVARGYSPHSVYRVRGELKRAGLLQETENE